jgi:hypothetical protein
MVLPAEHFHPTLSSSCKIRHHRRRSPDWLANVLLETWEYNKNGAGNSAVLFLHYSTRVFAHAAGGGLVKHKPLLEIIVCKNFISSETSAKIQNELERGALLRQKHQRFVRSNAPRSEYDRLFQTSQTIGKLLNS